MQTDEVAFNNAFVSITTKQVVFQMKIIGAHWQHAIKYSFKVAVKFIKFLRVL